MCLRPTTIRDKKYGIYYDVPCGKCPECQRAKSESWKFRLQQESLRKNCHSFFITLTYDNDNLPTYNGFGCFNKVHIRNFLLRFREEFYFWFYPKYVQVRDYYKVQKWKGAKAPYLRYFLVGEYGEQFSRPHYHAIIFTHKNITPESLENVIKLAWKKGLIDCQGANDAAIGYVSKYILKGYYDYDGECDDKGNCTKFRIRCSHNIGANFLQNKMEYKRAMHDAISMQSSAVPIYGTNCVSLTALPRYYRKKLQADNPALQWNHLKCIRFAIKQGRDRVTRDLTMKRHYLSNPRNQKQWYNYQYTRDERLVTQRIKHLKNFYSSYGKFEKNESGDATSPFDRIN